MIFGIGKYIEIRETKGDVMDITLWQAHEIMEIYIFNFTFTVSDLYIYNSTSGKSIEHCEELVKKGKIPKTKKKVVKTIRN